MAVLPESLSLKDSKGGLKVPTRLGVARSTLSGSSRPHLSMRVNLKELRLRRFLEGIRSVTFASLPGNKSKRKTNLSLFRPSLTVVLHYLW